MSAEIELKRVGIMSHPQLPEAEEEGIQVKAALEQMGIDCLHAPLGDAALSALVGKREIDLLIVLGGDGTVLRAGHLCAPSDVPILAINVGHFGFLIEVGREEWRERLPELAAGEYWLEERMMLKVSIVRNGKDQGGWEVLNEAMIGRGEIARPVHLKTELDGHPLTTYVADGLIVATATGSTAYALAAGGPILPPELRNILVIPVAPHLSVDRGIVLAEGSLISVEVLSDHQAMLNLDGTAPVRLEKGDCVKVQASKHRVRFVRFEESGYFYHHLISLMDQHPSAGGIKA